MKQALILCITLLLILSACGQASNAPATSPTTDEPTTISSSLTVAAETPTSEALSPPAQAFEAFYEDFKAAVSNRDMQFIDSILDDETSSSFGGDPGKEYFHEHWDNEKKYHGRDLWAVLDEIIALGGVHYQPGEYVPILGECFVAPYTFTGSNIESFDPGDYRLCLARKDSGWKLLFLIAGD